MCKYPRYKNKDLKNYENCVVRIDNIITGYCIYSNEEKKYCIINSQGYTIFNGFDFIDLIWKEEIYK